MEIGSLLSLLILNIKIICMKKDKLLWPIEKLDALYGICPKCRKVLHKDESVCEQCGTKLYSSLFQYGLRAPIKVGELKCDINNIVLDSKGGFSDDE